MSISQPLALADPRSALDPAFLAGSDGGFAWWYADALDKTGTGFVLIWSFGLPFLPGAGEVPAERQPVLNLALYDRGRPSFYLLQRLRPEDVEYGIGRPLRMDRSTIDTAFDGDRLRVRVALDCEVPAGGKLAAKIELTGSVPRFESEPGSPHVWCPLAPNARCTASFSTADGESELEGRAYHDFNASPVPLLQLGIERWTWGRAVSDRGALIYYLLWSEQTESPQAYVIEVADGRAPQVHRDVTVEMSEEKRGRYGLVHPRRLSLSLHGRPLLTVRTEHVVEDGPFYLRAVSRLEGAGFDDLGFSEWVLPARIDRAWQRPFVKMRIHDRGGPNSFLLPLFSGPTRGRLARLLGWRR